GPRGSGHEPGALGRPRTRGVSHRGDARDRSRARRVSRLPELRAWAARPRARDGEEESRMTLVVFAGPSLPPGELRARFPEFSFAGPAQCGDVYRAARQRPRAIGLIDGYFDHRLSVWHKELLWALSQAIPVYGAASMGALRAAELDVHGMIGVGVVYELFRRGELEEDDEVAVVHGP